MTSPLPAGSKVLAFYAAAIILTSVLEITFFLIAPELQRAKWNHSAGRYDWVVPFYLALGVLLIILSAVCGSRKKLKVALIPSLIPLAAVLHQLYSVWQMPCSCGEP